MLGQIRGFAFNPARQFAEVKDASLCDAYRYFIPLLAFLGAILAVVVTIVVNEAVAMLSLSRFELMPGLPELGKMIPMLGVATFVGVIVLGIIASFYLSVWLHIWVYLLGGRKGLRQTTKAIVYGMTPCLILGWLTPVNILIVPIWSLMVVISGIIELHELSPGRSIIAVLLAILVPVVVAAAAAMLVVSSVLLS